MNAWLLINDNYNLQEKHLHETLFTLGNGYFATRGSDEDSINDKNNYCGTYMAGIYNKLQSNIGDKKVINEDLVNLPNWLPITFKTNECDWMLINNLKLSSYCQKINMKKGILKRVISYTNSQGHSFKITSTRFVSMSNQHIAAIKYCITSENYSGELTIRSSLDGNIANRGVERYSGLSNKHLEVIELDELNEEIIFLKVKTNQSHIEIAQAAKTEIYINKQKISCASKTTKDNESINKEFTLRINAGQTIVVNKTVCIYTSKDKAISECLWDCLLAIKNCESYTQLLKKHINTWKYLWSLFDIKIDSIGNEQNIIRFHIFHSLQTLSKITSHMDAGAPARGLHGEAYRGHIFWDELFILPLYFYHFPEVARALLLYRFHRLNNARILAQTENLKGAMFPWQSGSNGEEETQKMHLNPQSNTWGPDYSSRQRHVNLAIVYNIWQYYLITDDIDFIKNYAAEIILEIAKFFSSLASFDEIKNQYEIKGVIGPDEYHEKYPKSKHPGLKNNAYTNVMVVWVLEKALYLIHHLNKTTVNYLKKSLNIDSEEIERWNSMTKKMFIPFHNGNIISQFEGYEKLQEFDWNTYTEKYGNIERLDRILKAESQSPDNFKISKQPDVLMLFYLLEEKEIERIFKQLGYKFNSEAYKENVQYYLQRTSHGSTLSKITFASILNNINQNQSYNFFQEALISDLFDTQGGTTKEGIHLGVMTGTIGILIKNYAGINYVNGMLSINPNLPKSIFRIAFKLLYKNNLYKLDINHEGLRIQLCEKHGENVSILYKNIKFNLFVNKKIILLNKDLNDMEVLS